MKGPDGKNTGLASLLFLFRDSHEKSGQKDGGEAVIDGMGADAVWELISNIFLEEIMDIPAIQMEALRQGIKQKK